MAKKTADGEEAKKGGPKKLLVPIVLLVAGLFAGKMMFVKPAEKTPEQQQAEAKAREEQVHATCAAANGEPAAGDAEHADAPSGEKPDATSDATSDETSDEKSSEKSGEQAAAPVVDTSAGPVLEMDPITLNLADGRYLKVGLGLQLAAGIDVEVFKDEGKGAKGRDLAIKELSKQTMDGLVPPEARQAAKKTLGMDTCVAYEAEVLTVYFTDFVMQ